MAKLTADDAWALADNLRELSQKVWDWADDHWDDLKIKDQADLRHLEIDLLSAASRVRVNAAGVVLDGIAPSVKELNKATADAKKTITAIKGVKDVINIAAAAIALAAAITSGAPPAIAAASGVLISAVAAAVP